MIRGSIYKAFFDDAAYKAFVREKSYQSLSIRTDKLNPVRI
jgi:hypothetical protein